MAVMRVLFLSAQMPGHLDWGGYLQTAAEMARRGHHTLWASGAEVQDAVTRANVPFRALAHTGWRWPPPPPLSADAAQDADSYQLLRQERALDQWLDVDRVAEATLEITDLAHAYRPDLMVSEMFVAAAGLVAERMDTPFAVAGWPAPARAERPAELTDDADPMTERARARLRTLLDRFDLAGTNWTAHGLPALRSPLLHLTYWSPTWFGEVESPPPTAHVGGRVSSPTPAPPADLPSPTRDPWVLITLGTSFNRDPNFFINAAHAASRMGCLPLVAFGGDLSATWVQATLPRLPKASIVRERVDFAAVLPYTRAAIHHGGAGTTHALIVHGVPQVVIPHAGDQARQARGVSRTGIGIYMPPANASLDALVACLEALLPDRSTQRAAALALQREFSDLGAVPAAADRLERIAALSSRPSDSTPSAPSEDSLCKP